MGENPKKKQVKDIALTAAKVRKSLVKTGFPFEMEVAEFLQSEGYEVEVNEYFLDLDEGKQREIDIVAFKTINKIQVNLVIECKHSLQDTWVFICSDKKPPRYFAYLTHTPETYELRKSRLLSHMQVLDHEVPLAQNYICLNKHKLKKSEQLQIDECKFKLPKAIIDIASRKNDHDKNLYFPLGVFSGQMFFAKYDGDLQVNESDLVHYGFDFDFQKYAKEKSDNRTQEAIGDPLFGYLSEFSDESRIQSFAKSKYEKFQIQFVTRDGLKKYLRNLEKDVSDISTRKWAYYKVPSWERKTNRLKRNSE